MEVEVAPWRGAAQRWRAERSRGLSKRRGGNVRWGWDLAGGGQDASQRPDVGGCLEKTTSWLRRDMGNADTAQEGAESCWAVDKSGVKGRS